MKLQKSWYEKEYDPGTRKEENILHYHPLYLFYRYARYKLGLILSGKWCYLYRPYCKKEMRFWKFCIKL